MTVPMLFANNASSRLFSSIDPITTSIRVENGDGAKFPSPGPGEFFTVTVEDRRTGQIEIMKCTSRSTDVLTVVRAMEGTGAWSFALGATISNRLTAATMDFLAHAGATGPTGPTGPQGPTGAVGPVGPTGPTGATGPASTVPGPQGPTGPVGPKGDQGVQGIQGVQGPVGPQGVKGDTGNASTVPGPVGPKGDQGIQGVQGVQGPLGPVGPAGPVGPMGGQIMYIGDGPPASPVVGQTWFESDSGNSFIFYDDGNSQQWVPSHVGVVPEVTPSFTTFEYMFDSATVEPPTSSEIRFNNSRQELTTEIWVHHTSSLGKDQTNAFSLVQVYDRFFIQDKDDATKWISFNVTDTPVNEGAYHSFPVTLRDQGAALPQQRVLFNIGTTGGGGGGGSGGPVAWGDITGKPATFPPTVPIAWADVSGTPATYPPTLPISSVDVSFTPIGTIAATNVSAALAELDTEKLAKTGGTLTGDLNTNSDIIITKATPGIALIKNNNNNAIITGRTTSQPRWGLYVANATPETGSNSGSDFSLERYSDAGNSLGVPLTISRATGLMTVQGDPQVALGVVTKQYVDAKITNKITVASTAPSSPAINDIWIDTT